MTCQQSVGSRDKLTHPQMPETKRAFLSALTFSLGKPGCQFASIEADRRDRRTYLLKHLLQPCSRLIWQPQHRRVQDLRQ